MITQTKDLYLEKILELVKEKRGLDFSQYRKNLLSRRVMARARLTKRDNFEQYLAYLKFHPEELDNLMEAMTINVTEFFRNAKVFEVIEKRVISDIITKKQKMMDEGRWTKDDGRTTINIWSCGCASGEEAYSVLMLIAEHLGAKLSNYKLAILGTDIDKEALAKAREGIYETYQLRNLTPERKALIDKYFYDVGNKRYWVREEWQGYMNFQYHDIIAEPPLENMDMILCRNLFIYFDRDLQNQVLERFWQSLRPCGFLALGIVESLLGSIKEKFIEYDRDTRIYIKR